MSTNIRIRKNRPSHSVPESLFVMACTAAGHAKFHRRKAIEFRSKAQDPRESSVLQTWYEKQAFANKQQAKAYYRTAWELSVLTGRRIPLLTPSRKPQAVAA